MAQFRIIKTVDFGNFTIGDKNYGPACPSCKVPINNYAPKVGDIIEGVLETKTFSVNGPQTVTGVSFPIRTNGNQSTTAQISDQFISQDHLELVAEAAPEIPQTPGQPVSDSPKGAVACWICENKIIPVILVILALVVLFLYLNKE